MNYLVYVFALVAVLAVNAEVDPGLRSTVSNAGIEYAKSIVQPMLIEEVSKMTFPSIEEKVHTPVGKVKFTISDIHFTEFAIAKSSITMTSPNVATVSISGMSMKLYLHWHYKKSFIHDSGHADVSTDGASTKISAEIGMDPSTGAPTVTISDTGFDVGSLHIKLHGGASWLYNLFIKAFHDKIRNSINKELRSKLSSTIGALVKQALESVPLSHDFGNGISLCYALADRPSVIDDFGGRFVAGSVAEFYATKEGRGKSPFKPSAMPKTTATSTPGPMLELFVNDYAINTLSFAFVHSGNTNMMIDDKNAPEEVKPMLVSDYYTKAVPGLVKKYGSKIPIRFDFTVTEVPTVMMQPEGFVMKAAATLGLDVFVNNTYTNVLDLDLSILVRGTASTKDTTLVGHLDVANVTATLKTSSVGDVSIPDMHDVVTITVNLANKQINDILAKGMPLPVVKGVSFVDPKIVWGSNYVVIATSFSYKP